MVENIPQVILGSSYQGLLIGSGGYVMSLDSSGGEGGGDKAIESHITSGLDQSRRCPSFHDEMISSGYHYSLEGSRFSPF